MPIELATHRALDAARKLPFCYLCGENLPPDKSKRNRDHVPPQGLFGPDDRQPVLKLPTDLRCHSQWSVTDQQTAQLIGLLRGERVSSRHRKLDVRITTDPDGEERVVLVGMDLRGIIRRCVRGFHAALYHEFLPETAERFFTIPPLPAAHRTGASYEYQVVPQHLATAMSDELERARRTGSLDLVRLRGDTCRYECVWVQSGDGHWCCVYALNIYDWTGLGDPRLPFGECMGFYVSATAVPPVGAARSTTLRTRPTCRSRMARVLAVLRRKL